MCYNISQKRKNRETIKNEFGMSHIKVDTIPSYYHLSGFQRGEVMVITEQEPETIQLATWSIAPPHSPSIKDYWKKTGGGCLNTRVESLFESKTPYWKKDAMLNNKCIVLIDGMFKIYTAYNGIKIPMYVRRPNSSLYGILGYHTEQDNFMSCSILTTDSDEFFKSFHKRMPFALEPEETDRFFDISTVEDYNHLIQTHNTNYMEYYPVHHDVINSRANSNREDITTKVNYPELNTLF
jgi:putative SOS response-associated peptidase YedK